MLIKIKHFKEKTNKLKYFTKTRVKKEIQNKK